MKTNNIEANILFEQSQELTQWAKDEMNNYNLEKAFRIIKVADKLYNKFMKKLDN